MRLPVIYFEMKTPSDSERVHIETMTYMHTHQAENILILFIVKWSSCPEDQAQRPPRILYTYKTSV